MAEIAFKTILNQLKEIKSEFEVGSSGRKIELLKTIGSIPLNGNANLSRQ
jgi:hypothetical protein